MSKKPFTIAILIFSSFCFLKSELNADTPRNIYTPCGTLVGDSYDHMTEMTVYWRAYYDNEYTQSYPQATPQYLWGQPYSSSRKYNCHGYAWHMIGDNAIYDPVWIGYDDEGQTYKYWQDESYSEVAVQYATMVDYSGDHSATTTGQTDIYISKWNKYPLMRHPKKHCPNYGNPVKFLRKNPATPSDFATIQAAINDAVPCQIVHVDAGVPALTSNVTVPSGVTLKINSGATVNLNGYHIICTGSGKIVKNGTVSGYKHYAKQGYSNKGFFSSSYSIQQIIDLASSGWNIYLSSGTYSNINMKAGVGLVGAGENSTTLEGSTVFFDNDDGASLALMTVNEKLLIKYSDNVDLSIKPTESCYIEAEGSLIYVSDFTSHISQSKAIYAHTYSDLNIWGGSIKNKSAVAVPVYYYSSGLIDEVYFCQNNIDISADPPGTDTYGCIFSSSQEGGSVSGDVYWEE